MRDDGRRPLLGLRRSDTRALCRLAGLDPVQDPSNEDPRFVRNRVRHELLPLLAGIAGRDVVPVLVRQAHLLRDEGDLLDALAVALDPSDARALAAAEPALARRAVRRGLRGDHPPSAAEVERVLAVARDEARACELSGGRRTRRSAGRMALGEPSPGDGWRPLGCPHDA
jgi:tRNA(Ile)-lysidine synthase